MIEISTFTAWICVIAFVFTFCMMCFFGVSAHKLESKLVGSSGHIKRLEDEMRLECAMIYDDTPTLEEEVDLEGLELQAMQFGWVDSGAPFKPGCK